MNVVRVIGQLTVPLRYLSVSGKRTIDFGLPALAALVVVATLVSFPVPLLSEKGLLARVNELLQVLVGFYVASLAAVATFPNVALDQQVKNSTLDGKPLTRRRFLSLLFGYLAFGSLVLYVSGVFAMLLQPALHQVKVACPLVVYVASFLYLAACANLVSVSLLGLYYLIEKIYEPDPVIIRKLSSSAISNDSEED